IDVADRMRESRRVTNLTFDGSSDIWDLIRDQENQEHLLRARYAEYGDQLLAVKIPEFFFSPNEVENIIGKIHKYPNLIIDLRGNPGGSVDTLKYLVGGMFDKEATIAERVGMK